MLWKKQLLSQPSYAAHFSPIAQTERYAIESYPSNVIRTIIRQYDNTQFVGYAETTNGNYFFLSDINMTILYKFDMPTGYYVNDFEIYRHDTVIMCGYYMSNTQDGFIGCFGIYQAFFLSYPIFLANNFLASTSNPTVPVREFKEVEVYEKPVMQGTKTSAVAVGILGGNTGGSCVLETIIDMSTFTPIWAYSSGTSGEYSEEMNQMRFYLI